MTDSIKMPRPLLNGWRIAGWGAALALLMLPAIAMQFTGEVDWTGGDFLFAAILIGALGSGVEVAVRVGRTGPKRIGLILASVTGFLTLWSNAAVGIIGDGDNALNIGFAVIVLAAAIASVAARFRSKVLARVFALAGAGQAALLGAAALTSPVKPVEYVAVGIFAALWLISAWLVSRD